LADEDDDGDPGRKADDDGIGNVLDHGSQAREPKYQQDHSRHQRGDLQAGDAVLRRDDREYGNECAGGAGNLNASASEN
jgi:hypothetical protein